MNRKLQTISIAVSPILKKHKINFAAIFGSFARGEQKRNSDLDILVRFSEPVSYFDLLDAEEAISKKLKLKKIDMVTEGALHPDIAKNIKKDLQVIYGVR